MKLLSTQEFNYMLLLMIRDQLKDDRDLACASLGLSLEVGAIISTLTPADMLSIAKSHTIPLFAIRNPANKSFWDNLREASTRESPQFFGLTAIQAMMIPQQSYAG